MNTATAADPTDVNALPFPLNMEFGSSSSSSGGITNSLHPASFQNTPIFFDSYLKNTDDYNRYLNTFQSKTSASTTTSTTSKPVSTSPTSFSASSKKSDDAKQAKLAKKRRRGHIVKKACLHCRRSHRACDENRPCKRCVEAGRTCEEDVSQEDSQTKSDFLETLPSATTTTIPSSSATTSNTASVSSTPANAMNTNVVETATVVPPPYRSSSNPFVSENMYNNDASNYASTAYASSSSNPHPIYETNGSPMPPHPYHDPLFSSNFMDHPKSLFLDQYAPNPANDYQPPLQSGVCPYSGQMNSWQQNDSTPYQAPLAHPTYSDIDNSDLINQLRNLQIVVENQNKMIQHLQALQRQYPPSNNCQWIGTPSPLVEKDRSKWSPESIWCLKTHRLLGCNLAFCEVMGYTLQELAEGKYSAVDFTPERYTKNTILMCSHLSQNVNKPLEVKLILNNRYMQEICLITKMFIDTKNQLIYSQHTEVYPHEEAKAIQAPRCPFHNDAP